MSSAKDGQAVDPLAALARIVVGEADQVVLLAPLMGQQPQRKVLASIPGPKDNGAGALNVTSSSGGKTTQKSGSIPDKDHAAGGKESTQKNHAKGKQPS